MSKIGGFIPRARVFNFGRGQTLRVARNAARRNRNERISRRNRPRDIFTKGGGGGNSGVDTIQKLNLKVMDPFPPRMSCKLKYVESLAFACPNTNLAYRISYRTNSPYAPNIANGSGPHQPYGWDQMAALYGAYICKGVMATIEYYDPDQDGVILGYQVQGTDPSGSAASVLMERPWSKSQPLSNTGNQVKTFKIYIDNAKALQIKKAQYMDDLSLNAAATTASPGSSPVLYLWGISSVGGTVTNMKCKLTLVYYVDFYSRITQAQS